jgi:hypothetical protein
MATTGPANGGVPSSAAAAVAVSTTPNSVMSTPAITSSSSVADGVASSATGTGTAPTPKYNKIKYIAFWDSDGAGVDSWIGKITGPFQNVVASTTPTATATTTPSSTTDDNNNIKKEQEGTYLYDALCAVLYTAPYIGILTVDYPWSENKTTQKRTFILYNVLNIIVTDVDRRLLSAIG